MPTIIHIQETTSTNDYLQQKIKNELLEEGSVVVCDFQTQGRGAANNKWESEKNKNLLFSMLLYPDFVEIKKQFIISQVVSLGLVDYLNTITSGFTVKWPNDIYWQDKKIAGILIENNLRNNFLSESIIGIGLNINQIKFLSDAPNPVSLKNIMGFDYDLGTVLTDVQKSIFARYLQLLQGGTSRIQKDYKKAMYRNEGFYLYEDKNGVFLAKIHQVKEEGFLVLETENKEKRQYAFKEVLFKIL